MFEVLNFFLLQFIEQKIAQNSYGKFVNWFVVFETNKFFWIGRKIFYFFQRGYRLSRGGVSVGLYVCKTIPVRVVQIYTSYG